MIVEGNASDGKRLKEQFMEKTPAIRILRDVIEDTLVASSKWTQAGQKIVWRKRAHKSNEKLDATRCLIGLDGRLLHIRSPHAALNTLLQSAGALICKKWVCILEKNLREAGYKHGWDGDFALMAWVHDEVQIAARTKEIAEDVIKVCQESMREVQQYFNFKCQLDTEGKIGHNWSDCH